MRKFRVYAQDAPLTVPMTFRAALLAMNSFKRAEQQKAQRWQGNFPMPMKTFSIHPVENLCPEDSCMYMMGEND